MSGMMYTLSGTLITCAMMIGHHFGVEAFVSCNPQRLRVIPYHVSVMSLAIIAVDKAVAITSPFKHKKMMTSRAVNVIISGAWLLALIPTFISDVDGVMAVPEYGECLFVGDGYTEVVILIILPTFVTSVVTIILNVYLAMKAYQVYKQIEKETKLSGQTDNLKVLKKKQRNIRQNMKPIVTLLLVIFGNVVITLLLVPLHVLGRHFISSQAFQELTDYIITPNTIFVLQFFYALVFGLYFKEVREPMMKRLRRFLRMNKVNSIAPQP